MGTIMYKGSEAPITYRGQKSPMMYKDEEYNVSEPPINYIYKWDFTKAVNPLVDEIQQKTATLRGTVRSTSKGVEFTNNSGRVELFTELIAPTETEDIVMELKVGNMSLDGDNMCLLFASFKETAALGIGWSKQYAPSRWRMLGPNDSYADFSDAIGLTDPSVFANSNVKIVFHKNVSLDLYKNNVHIGFCDYRNQYSSNNVFRLIGGYQQSSVHRRSFYTMFIKEAKIYYQNA